MSDPGSAEIIQRFAAIPYICAISDKMDEMGLTNQVLPSEIQAIFPCRTLAGRALTIVGEHTTSSDPKVIFVPFLKMLGEIKPGDVLVSQPNDEIAAHLGELSSEAAQYRGARGAVIDGGVRDTERIQEIGFPVFARYKTPQDIVGRWRLVEFNVPITIGRVQIHPGDYVVGDRDGVLIVPESVAGEVVAKAEVVVGTENVVRKDILRGVHPVDAFERHGRF